MADLKDPVGAISEIWVIDQVSSGVASVELAGGATVSIPVALLPHGAGEGDVLTVSISQGDGARSVTIALDPAEKARRLANSAAQVAKGGKGGKGNIVL